MTKVLLLAHWGFSFGKDVLLMNFITHYTVNYKAVCIVVYYFDKTVRLICVEGW